MALVYYQVRSRIQTVAGGVAYDLPPTRDMPMVLDDTEDAALITAIEALNDTRISAGQPPVTRDITAAYLGQFAYGRIAGLQSVPADRFLRTAAGGELDARTAAQFRADIGANDSSNQSTGTLPDAQLSANVYRRANIVGTVSESGGVPTGAIIQEGSGPNGRFTRWAGGRQEIIKSFSDLGEINTARGQLFISPDYDVGALPAAFTSIDHYSIWAGRSGSTNTDLWVVPVNTDGPGFPNRFALMRATSQGGTNYLAYVKIVGRWN